MKTQIKLSQPTIRLFSNVQNLYIPAHPEERILSIFLSTLLLLLAMAFLGNLHMTFNLYVRETWTNPTIDKMVCYTIIHWNWICLMQFTQYILDILFIDVKVSIFLLFIAWATDQFLGMMTLHSTFIEIQVEIFTIQTSSTSPSNLLFFLSFLPVYLEV